MTHRDIQPMGEFMASKTVTVTLSLEQAALIVEGLRRIVRDGDRFTGAEGIADALRHMMWERVREVESTNGEG